MTPCRSSTTCATLPASPLLNGAPPSKPNSCRLNGHALLPPDSHTGHSCQAETCLYTYTSSHTRYTSQAAQRSPSNSCPDAPVLQLPSGAGLYWWGNYSAAPDGTGMTRCGASVVAFWQLVKETAASSSSPPSMRGVPRGVLRAAQTALVSNETSRFACALQVCNASTSLVYCLFDTPSSELLDSNDLRSFATNAGVSQTHYQTLLLVPFFTTPAATGAAACPSTQRNPAPGSDVAAAAQAARVLPNQLVCYGGYLNRATSTVPALAIPCASTLPADVTCEAEQLSGTQWWCRVDVYTHRQALCLLLYSSNTTFTASPLPLPMSYTLQPGENFTTVVKGLQLPLTPCALCCVNNFSSSSRYGFAACNPAPFTTILLPAGNVRTGYQLLCVRACPLPPGDRGIPAGL